VGKFLRGLLWVAGVLSLIAILLRLTVLDVWRIPDDPIVASSLAPSLREGDLVVLLTRGTPGFGDLVRCTDPEDAQRFVVGRIGGVAGDRVELDGRNLTVNGKAYVAGTACTKRVVSVTHPSTGAEVELVCDTIELAGGFHMRGSSATPSRSAKSSHDVGAGMVFLVSDNREHHDDSRDFGALPLSSCTARVVYRLVGKGGWSDDETRLQYVQ
jgi:signal peptidase I